MSALPPKADIRQRMEHVCLVPKAELIASRHLAARGCIEDQLRSTNQKTFLDGMLRFVTAITGWIFLPVGCFFRRAEVERRLTVGGASGADDVGAELTCEL